MQLIETIGGVYVNADYVATWRELVQERKPGPPGDDGGTWGLYDDAGKLLGTTDADPTLCAWPVVPAYPGFRMLVIVPGDEPTIEEHHVIAWRIAPVGDFPMPVTLQDIPTEVCVIQSPTDRIVAQGWGEFANREALLAAYKQHKAEAARDE